MSVSLETPPVTPELRHVPRFYVLDFDRCLGSVQGLFDELVKAIAVCGYVSEDELRAARREVEASGGSFDALSQLRTRYGLDDTAIESVLSQFLAEDDMLTSDMLLEPHARDFLDYLDQNDIPYAIMSYGGDVWQTAKIKKAGLGHVPQQIVSQKVKGVEIASWWDTASSSFILPPQLCRDGGVTHAARVTLIDDKASAFIGLDTVPNSDGYQMRLSQDLLLSQQGALPQNVHVVMGWTALCNILEQGESGDDARPELLS